MRPDLSIHRSLPELDAARLKPGLRDRTRRTAKPSTERHIDAVDRALRLLDQRSAA